MRHTGSVIPPTLRLLYKERNIVKQTYNCRAECLTDMMSLISACDTAGLNTDVKLQGQQKSEFPDIEIRIITEHSLDELLKVTRNIPDGHVMHETLELEKEFTGIRKYGRE